MQTLTAATRPTPLQRLCLRAFAIGALCGAVELAPIARADVVTVWNGFLQDAVKTGLGTTPPLQGRAMAIVQAAVFDAVNGIERRYDPYYVTERAPEGASADAAAIQAAYTAMSALLPAQQAKFDTELATSLAALPGSRGRSRAIDRGRAWGEKVANLILQSRSQDGSSTILPPYIGGTGPGVWRSIPDGTLAGAFAQLTIMTPFAIQSPSQFRPGPPPGLGSVQYATDLNEIKAIGSVNSAVRTAEQTDIAKLWAAVDLTDENQIARGVLDPHASLVENARVLALANITAADCLIASFDCKYTYNLWRPFHAIRLADTDGNPLTDADPTWTSLITAPRFPEYVSNHAILTGGFLYSLALLRGDEQSFTLSSPGYAAFTFSFDRLSDAVEQAKFGRMWGGLHFRNSCDVGQAMGLTIAKYIHQHILRPIHTGDRDRGEGHAHDQDHDHGRD